MSLSETVLACSIVANSRVLVALTSLELGCQDLFVIKAGNRRRDVVWFYSQLRLINLVLGIMTSSDVDVKQLPVEVVFHIGRYLGCGREATPGEAARHTILHSEVESKGSVTEGSRQDFSALELGPVCLVLGIDGGPQRVLKVPISLLRNVEEPLTFPVSVGTNCATPGSGDT